MKKFLHVGCGVNTKSSTTKGFNTADWLEIRYDIDKSVNPDYVGSMTDMGVIDDGSVEGIFSSHNIEHLYAHEVPLALAEFFRVLNDDGVVVVTCPDLKSVCELVGQDMLTETVYESPAGPIAPIDMLYGYRPDLQQGKLFMAHRCGFTEKVLSGTFQAAGFMSNATMSRGAPYFDLWGVITKSKRSDEELKEIAEENFPV
jgi:hypothetical protein